MMKEFDRVVMFDGAMGTMLQKKGLKLREIPESLNVSRPDLIESIHREYFAAGCDFVQTNTFGANPYKLEGTAYETEQVIGAAVKIARRAADAFSGKGILLDVGPSGRAMAPVGDADFDEIYGSVARQVRAGAELCDGILLETFTDLLEAKASALAALENSDKPVFLTMSFQEDGRTFFGTPVEAMIMTFEGLGLSGLGVNCSLGPAQLAPIVKKLTAHSRVPVIVQPNAGLPVVRDGVSGWDVSPGEFANWLGQFVDWGTAFVGGCCGTTPEFLSAANDMIGNRRLRPRKVAPLRGVCSATRVEPFDRTVIIGERLNPTGKKRLKQALYEHDFDYVVLEAQKQKEQGAGVLDVNVGLPDVDEPAMLREVVAELQGAVDLPLQLDSANAAALEAGARRYAGKPLLNSVSGKESSLASVLPVAKKYGACVLGLCLDDGGIPQTAEARFAVAQKILDRAAALGIPKDDVFIDCLTLTASAQQDLALETIKAVRMVSERLAVKTTLGVSNVSFGLPRRPLINRTMLAAALANGLSAAIVNPGEKSVQETLAAWRVLSAQDRDAKEYIDFCAANPEETAFAPRAVAAVSERGKFSGGLGEAVARGLKDEARACAAELVKKQPPLEIVEKTLIPALDAVGRDYEAQKIYLPQLIKSADAAKAALEVVKGVLAGDQGGAPRSGPKVIVATVYGDVHDIGKNIVKVIMENYNFDVIDLGKDVSSDAIVAAVKKTGAAVVGLSALMTTTVASMKETIAALRRECPEVRVIVGGAVLTPDLARHVGADRYARDAMDTVRAVEEFLSRE
ncbi:putative 5-methyltetrahydrofolate--homocysteine methyltransferase [Pyramidobacter piscolens W5455]|uniref:Methionine synthase n=1 Tax=Pyramidobacter piscolens W5455 TaxID=352165 RepID=A0ABM9ZTP2_9BACT|nr:homocysteine S-methyltransferase family protein [Pyramidobacter piscolens]EFB90221.1 putative 5-methyltetrahydrofolate--homocysteine methyltransferase [Pyramidobacter piscolens W5455]BDF78247.1 5-methyltetrahydrofolate--homocysteine methyltransferase [Pyramidobacter piscolens]